MISYSSAGTGVSKEGESIRGPTQERGRSRARHFAAWRPAGARQRGAL